MIISTDRIVAFVVGIGSAIISAIVIEKWKKRSALDERILKLEDTLQHLQEKVEDLTNKTHDLGSELQEATRQVATNAALLQNGKSKVEAAAPPAKQVS
jgi:uncharacterized protein YlxW (UPF0749 family)